MPSLLKNCLLALLALLAAVAILAICLGVYRADRAAESQLDNPTEIESSEQDEELPSQLRVLKDTFGKDTPDEYYQRLPDGKLIYCENAEELVCDTDNPVPSDDTEPEIPIQDPQNDSGGGAYPVPFIMPRLR